MSKEKYISGLFFIQSDSKVRTINQTNFINVDLNEGAKGQFIYPIKLFSDSKQEAITNFMVLYGQKVQTPQGYVKIYQDLSQSVKGYVFIAYTTSPKEGSPIVDIQFFSKNYPIKQGENIQGFTVSGGDLNKGAGGKYIYLGVKRN